MKILRLHRELHSPYVPRHGLLVEWNRDAGTRKRARKAFTEDGSCSEGFHRDHVGKSLRAFFGPPFP